MDIERREGAVEVCGPDPDQPGEFGPSFRARLLLFGDQGLMIQMPAQAQALRYLRPGGTIRILAVVDQQRWYLFCTIHEFTSHGINARLSVPAMRLSPPHDIRTAQRREHFRASCLGVALERVVFAPMIKLPETGELKSHPEHQPFKAMLVDASPAGVRIAVPIYATPYVPKVELFAATLNLPTCDRLLEVTARFIHVLPQRDRSSHVGLQFIFDTREQQRTCGAVMNQFTVWLQRQHLKRESSRRE